MTNFTQGGRLWKCKWNIFGNCRNRKTDGTVSHRRRGQGRQTKTDEAIKNILSGKDDRFLLIIGPCSADNERAVLDYIHRLVKVQEQVKDQIFIIPRVYTSKPRTIGVGYKGMLHQPDPEGKEDMLGGIIAIRELNTRVVQETGFTCAEEILYPEIFRYLSDLLSYAAVAPALLKTRSIA